MNVNVVVFKCLLLSCAVFTLIMILHLDVGFFCSLKDPLENEMVHLKGLSLKINK